MKYEYFIASRWRNKESVLELVKKIQEKGKTVYNFIEGDGTDYKLKDTEEKLSPEEFMKIFESYQQDDPQIREVFNVDMNALRASKNIILLLPAGKSAHIEIGVAYGMGKKCILIGEHKEAESLYCIFDERYPTIDTFIDSL